MAERLDIVVAGAGSIGCLVGGALAAVGHRITLLGRPRILSGIAENGLTISDYSGARQTVPATQLTLSDDPGCLSKTPIILVTVKSAATAGMAAAIAAHAHPAATILSLQNGVENADTLTSVLPGRHVRAGMVPFNVVPQGPGAFHRSSSGALQIGVGPGNLAETLTSPFLPVQEVRDIRAAQWGKLLINLNNAPNALSGLALRDMLLDPAWRALMADQMAEALRVLSVAGVKIASTTPLPAWVTPHILRLPTPLFRRIAARMITIDPSARTSMAYDLDAGRTTEIDAFQGVIVALGEKCGVPTPLNTRLLGLVHQAQLAGQGCLGLSVSQILG
jgi:2-dehydropantoate 2-reductase